MTLMPDMSPEARARSRVIPDDVRILRTSERGTWKRSDIRNKNSDGTGSNRCPEGCVCGKHKRGKDHRNWTEEPTRSAIHQRLNKTPAKDQLCVDCGDQAKDWSRVTGSPGDVIEDYDPRCRSCHTLYDYDARWGDPEYRANQTEKQRAKALKQWAEKKKVDPDARHL